MGERGYTIFAPEEKDPDKDSEVFFNTEMRLNRDLSEIASRVFRDRIDVESYRVADPLSGSGIRGFRYSEHADEVHLNDSNPEAVESIKKGLEENGIEAEVHEKDANVFLSENWNRFHLVDIDPFGPFTNFLDSAVRAANHRSLVGLTATDNSAPTGSYRTVCRRRYGAEPLKNSFMHETALRIYIREAFRNFARFDKCFEPKVCWHERHYSRVIGRVTESKKRTNRNLGNIGELSFCPECRWRKLERAAACGNCGNTDLAYAGPLWTGKLSDQRFTGDMLEEIPDEWQESREFLQKIDSEAEILTPFYDVHELASTVEVSVPPRDELIGSLRDRGYPVSRTHFSPTGFRTDAPVSDVREMVEETSP